LKHSLCELHLVSLLTSMVASQPCNSQTYHVHEYKTQCMRHKGLRWKNKKTWEWSHLIIPTYWWVSTSGGRVPG
jgi:hypothetical protein